MRSITIAGKSLPITVPADLDAQLVEATGCSSAEIVASLGYFTLAGQIAAVLRPLLPADIMPGIELADALQAELAADRGKLLAAIRDALAVKPALTKGSEA